MHKERLVALTSANLQSVQLLLPYRRLCRVDFASSSSLSNTFLHWHTGHLFNAGMSKKIEWEEASRLPGVVKVLDRSRHSHAVAASSNKGTSCTQARRVSSVYRNGL
jgi:hypothetical protein